MWLRSITRYFIRGSLVTVPIAATLYALYLVFITIDRFLAFDLPGLGLVVTVTGVTAIGFLSSNVLGRGIVEIAERLLKRLPLVNLIYTSVKDLIHAFVGDKRRFDEPVSVALDSAGTIRILGFVTRKDLRALGLSGSVAIYLPQSYNFAGNVVIVPAGAVRPLDVPSGELMTFIVSGGVSGFGVGKSTLPSDSPPKFIG